MMQRPETQAEGKSGGSRGVRKKRSQIEKCKGNAIKPYILL